MNTNHTSQQQSVPSNTVLLGNCIDLMSTFPANSVDFVLTDPPYLVNYRDRYGRSIQNDVTDGWMQPAFAEIYRVLKQDAFCVSFYSWTRADRFMAAWRSSGFHVVGHLVFRKAYASQSRFVRYQHEQAYLLAKGRPSLPVDPIPDVIDMPYSGNGLHPTQKPVSALRPLIKCFSREGDLVLDPFCGSGSTLIAARSLNRRYLGIELDPEYHAVASKRLLTTELCPPSARVPSCPSRLLDASRTRAADKRCANLYLEARQLVVRRSLDPSAATGSLSAKLGDLVLSHSGAILTSCKVSKKRTEGS